MSAGLAVIELPSLSSLISAGLFTRASLTAHWRAAHLLIHFEPDPLVDPGFFFLSTLPNLRQFAGIMADSKEWKDWLSESVKR